MTIFNFESVWTVEAQIDYDLGFRLRVPFACVSNPLYIHQKKKNQQWAIRYLLSVNYARAHSGIKPTIRSMHVHYPLIIMG